MFCTVPLFFLKDYLLAVFLFFRFLFLLAPFVVTVEAAVIHNVVSGFHTFGLGNRYFFEAYLAGNCFWFYWLFLFGHFDTSLGSELARLFLS